jgi:hypothetical protein
MPIVAPAVTGINSKIYLDNVMGVFVDISSDSNSFDLDLSAENGVFYTYGVGQQAVEATREDKITLKGVSRKSVRSTQNMLEEWRMLGDTRLMQIKTPDERPGARRYQSLCLLSTFKFSNEAGQTDPVMWEIELQPIGNVIMDTIV